MKGRYRPTCGSGLARERAGPFKVDVACYTAFASKPAPTRIATDREIGFAQIFQTPPLHSG